MQIISGVWELLTKVIVINTAQDEGKFIDSILLRLTPDGTNRVILNLKSPNQTFEYNHFKMETNYSVASLIQQKYDMLKINWKDAYLSIKIFKEHKIS